MEATILETSPKDALGLDPLMAACVSRKNKAYAETGLLGSLGSFFFLLFLETLGFFPLAGPSTLSDDGLLPRPICAKGVESSESSLPGEGDPPEFGEAPFRAMGGRG